MEKIRIQSMIHKYKLYLNGVMRWKVSATEARLYKEKIAHGKQMSGLAQMIGGLENIFNKRRNKAFYDIKELMHSNVFEKLMMRCESRYREQSRSALDKLVQNALKQRIRDSKFQNVLNRIHATSQRRSAVSMSQMQCYSVEQKYLQELRLAKLREIMLQKQLREVREAYSYLEEHHRSRELFQRVINRAQSTYSYERLSYYTNKWKHSHRLAQNGQRMQIFSNMMKIINKNHQMTTQNAMRKWASGNSRRKCENLSHIIEKLVKLRKQQSYDTILHYSDTLKRDQIRRGIVLLIRKTEKFKESRAIQAFNAMRVEKINPWFKRVVNIWTLQTHVDHQISFWRMRLNKKIGGSRVTPQQAVKLKKLSNLLNRKVFKNLSKAFWRIDQGHNTPDDMNVSFAVMPGRTSNLNNRLSQMYNSGLQ